ncbi:uncharacterized protein [Macrobrachium rosenbergii]|uniref:uncharacterized protein n=1 Tax=Macrobrachium rosenbergii TaxID=79674 RepID=UPI0034D6BA10
MKFLVVAAVCAVAVVGQEPITPKTAVRMLPADVLRDFPGTCFASTACRVFPVGESWPLTPFCGQATCSQGETGLIEKVEDCGLRPKPSPNCTVVNEADLQRPFPACCPKYVCDPGFELEFPTEEELAAAAEAQAKAAQAAAAAATAASAAQAKSSNATTPSA